MKIEHLHLYYIICLSILYMQYLSRWQYKQKKEYTLSLMRFYLPKLICLINDCRKSRLHGQGYSEEKALFIKERSAVTIILLLWSYIVHWLCKILPLEAYIAVKKISWKYTELRAALIIMNIKYKPCFLAKDNIFGLCNLFLRVSSIMARLIILQLQAYFI